MKEIDVSVIVPIYKGNKYLSTILKMIEKNAEQAKNIKIELLLVNDSPDVALQVDYSIIPNYQLTVVENPTNLGIQAARINGIKQASGKYIMMLDQDDTIEDYTIVSQMSCIGSLDAVLSNGYYENESLEKIPLYKNTKQMRFANDSRFYFYFGNLIASPGLCIIKKESIPVEWLENIISINGADDWLLWTAFILSGRKFAINPEKLYTHKNVGNNTSNDDEKMLLSSVEALDRLEKVKHIPKIYKNAYRRRLKMRSKYEYNGLSFSKIMQYLLNIDIMWFVFRIKFVV